MWHKFVPGESPFRPIRISKELNTALRTFTSDKSISIQFFFESSVIMLWNIWNGYSGKNECKSSVTAMKVRGYLNNSIIPDENKVKKIIYLNIRDKKLFKWISKLEEIDFITSTEDGIRRILIWGLKQRGYL